MEKEYSGSEIYHHGIPGQKWGQKNGPPYPLDRKDYSAAELKEARRPTSSNLYLASRQLSRAENKYGAKVNKYGRALDKNTAQKEKRDRLLKDPNLSDKEREKLVRKNELSDQEIHKLGVEVLKAEKRVKNIMNDMKAQGYDWKTVKTIAAYNRDARRVYSLMTSVGYLGISGLQGYSLQMLALNIARSRIKSV